MINQSGLSSYVNDDHEKQSLCYTKGRFAGCKMQIKVVYEICTWTLLSIRCLTEIYMIWC